MITIHPFFSTIPRSSRGNGATDLRRIQSPGETWTEKKCEDFAMKTWRWICWRDGDRIVYIYIYNLTHQMGWFTGKTTGNWKLWFSVVSTIKYRGFLKVSSKIYFWINSIVDLFDLMQSY